MFHLIKIIIFSILICSLPISYVWSQDIGVSIGFRSDSADSDLATMSAHSETSLSFGLVGKMDLSEIFALRLGMQYVPRQYRLQSRDDLSSELFKFIYFELPLALLYKVSDFGGLFAGVSVGFGLDRVCGQLGSCHGVGNSLASFQLGASFKVAPQFGLEVFYEKGLSHIAFHLRDQRAVGANLLITFD
jgi:hypothetical protein